MKWTIWILALLLICGAASSRPIPDSQNDETKSIQDLEMQVRKLEQKINVMQKQIDALRSGAYVSRLSVQPNQQIMPPGSKSFQFNDMRVWNVPAARKDDRKGK